MTWLAFNLGAQAVPILYLWSHSEEEEAAIWEYVNCTLALLVAFGMLIAAISDMITERGRIGLAGWLAIVVIAVMAALFLHRATHDEFVRHERPDSELFCASLIAAAFIIGTGTFLKARIWYTQTKLEHGA